MSPIPIGIFAASGAGGAPAGAFELINSISGAGSSSVTFSSIPSTYKHLQLRCVMKVTESSNNNAWSVLMRLNGATSGYAWHRLRGNGSDVTSEASTSATSMTFSLATGSGGSTPAQVFSPAIVDILDYASTSKNTTIRSLSSGLAPASTSFVELRSGLWTSTSAVTSITLLTSTSNWATGTRFSLYGIKG